MWLAPATSPGGFKQQLTGELRVYADVVLEHKQGVRHVARRQTTLREGRPREEVGGSAANRPTRDGLRV
eukprot:COSAG06_NODE_9287_length_1938_cov_3.995106_1_plen_68_part_10